MKTIVLIGAGHAHVEVIRAFAVSPEPGVALAVISPCARVPYTGMAPGHVAGKYTFEEISIDARRLTEKAGGRFIQARATKIDRARRVVLCDDGTGTSYDVASIDVGGIARSPLAGDGSVAMLATKPVEAFLERLQAFARDGAAIAVVGGGPGGVELAAALAHRGARVSLLAGRYGVLPECPESARRAALKRLGARSISIIEGADATSAAAGEVALADGRTARADAVVLAAGIEPAPLVASLDLARDAAGFLKVSATLASLEDPSIFAAGDCAGFDAGLKKAGVHAVRQGPVLARNLRAAASGNPLETYRPQKEFLSILSFWPDGAVAMRGGLTASGKWVEAWKESIDRKFVARYRVD